MKKKTGILSTLLILTLTLVLFVGCGDGKEKDIEVMAKSEGETEETKEDKSEETEEQESLVIGTDGGYFPYCFINDDGELDGFEVALWKEVENRINKEIQIDAVEWTGIFGMVDTGKIDTVACQITINEERKEKYEFSEVYMYTDQILSVKAGNEDTIKKFDDMAGKRIGVCVGGNTFDSLEDFQKTIDFELVPYETSTGMFHDIEYGRIDAGYINELTVAGAIEKGEFDLGFANCEPLYSEVNAYPYVKRENNETIWADVNEAIKSMHADGTMSELSNKWFGVDATIKKDNQ